LLYRTLIYFLFSSFFLIFFTSHGQVYSIQHNEIKYVSDLRNRLTQRKPATFSRSLPLCIIRLYQVHLTMGSENISTKRKPVTSLHFTSDNPLITIVKLCRYLQITVGFVNLFIMTIWFVFPQFSRAVMI
jgi:hypothetical protein